MGVGSVIVGIVSLLFVFGGILGSVIPFVGTFLAFGAPLLAVAGIVLGGLALSRAKRDGEPTGAATAGLILNVVALIPALLVAVTCGLCNACVSAGMMNPNRSQQTWWLDGGAAPSPFGPGFPAGPADGSTFQPTPSPGQPGAPGQPPPAFPPPPLDEPSQPGAAADEAAPGAAADEPSPGAAADEASPGDEAAPTAP